MSKRDESLMELCVLPVHRSGKVNAIGHVQGVWTVSTEQGELTAKKAASCLLTPQADDHVWLSGDMEIGIFITAILERSSEVAQKIVLPTGSSIEVSDGALMLRADSLQFFSKLLTVQTDTAAICAQKVTGVGREATWSFGSIKVMSDLLETFADKLIQFSRWSQRTVDGIDQVRSRQIDYRADQLMQLQAENLIANATNLVKVDGEQIHLG